MNSFFVNGLLKKKNFNYKNGIYFYVEKIKEELNILIENNELEYKDWETTWDYINFIFSITDLNNYCVEPFIK